MFISLYESPTTEKVRNLCRGSESQQEYVAKYNKHQLKNIYPIKKKDEISIDIFFEVQQFIMTLLTLLWHWCRKLLDTHC